MYEITIINLKRFKMKFSNFIFALLLGGLVIYSPGCQEISEELADIEPDGVDTLEITMIAKSSFNPVFLSAKKGAFQEAAELSEKYNLLHVTVNWEAPENEDASVQAEMIRKAVNSGTDAIIVSCSDKDSLTAAINNAVDAGVEVMTFDSDSPDSKRFAFYGPDDQKMGKMLISRLAELIDGKGKIAILGGNPHAPNLQERVAGMIDTLAQFPGIENVGVFYHNETEDDAIAQMDSVQKMHPDLKGWAMVGSWALFGNKLLEKIEPGKIKIVAVDALPVQLKYIKQNYVQVLLGQPTYRWGKTTVEAIVKKMHEKEKVKEILRLEAIPVTIENLGGWSRQLRAWGYTNIPEEYFVL